MTFEEITSNPDLWERTIAGSMSHGASLEEWTEKRRFIAELIDSDGSILDIGCANGFFLKSLQEWSGKELLPYGIDVQENLIEQAGVIFPEYQDNFRVLDVTHIEKIESVGLLSKYNFVYWNFLGSWDITEEKWQTVFHKVKSLANRRLIIGFYGANQYGPQSPEWHDERNRLLQKIGLFQNAGITFSGTHMNPSNYNQLVAWIDVKII